MIVEISGRPSARSPVRAVTVTSEVMSEPELVMNCFAAVDDPLAVVEHRLRLGRSGVRAGAGLGQPEAGRSVSGAWRLETDPRLRAARDCAIRMRARRSAHSALPAPTDYFELTFDVVAGVPYRLWLRGRADRNFWGNDTVYVQFSDGATATGAPANRIGTTAATTVVLEDGPQAVISGWGWQDNGYGVGVLGPQLYFSRTGTQTLRVQTREDGMAIDQIVLSAGRFLQMAPGSVRDDTTILPR